MTRVPNPPSSLPDTIRFGRELVNYLAETDPIVSSNNTLISRTTKGTLRSARPGGMGGVGAAVQFKGEYDPTQSYVKDDIVICSGPQAGLSPPLPPLYSELDDGNQAGTFIATADISPSDPIPGDKCTTATANVMLTGGVVSSISMSNPGSGYKNAPTIVIAGDGTGATAIAIVGLDGSLSISVTAPGSGYTTASVTIPSPGTQKWADFALGRWQKLTLRVANKRIVIDAGRGDPANPPLLSIYQDFNSTTDSDAGVEINLNDIPAGAGKKKLTIREVPDCSTGVYKHRLEICSDVY